MRKKLFNYKGSSGGDPFPQEACPVKFMSEIIYQEFCETT